MATKAAARNETQRTSPSPLSNTPPRVEEETVESIKERYNETGITIRDQSKRLHDLQLSAFHLANYYFVFQGVIIAALFNSPASLRCNHRWFLPVISGGAASINLAALYSIGIKFIKVNKEYDETWTDYDVLYGKLVNPAFRASSNSSPKVKHSVKELKHTWLLWTCMGFFLFFAGFTIYGCLYLFCGENDVHAISTSNSCVKICDSRNCVKVCTKHY